MNNGYRRIVFGNSKRSGFAPALRHIESLYLFWMILKEGCSRRIGNLLGFFMCRAAVLKNVLSKGEGNENLYRNTS